MYRYRIIYSRKNFEQNSYSIQGVFREIIFKRCISLLLSNLNRLKAQNTSFLKKSINNNEKPAPPLQLPFIQTISN